MPRRTKTAVILAIAGASLLGLAPAGPEYDVLIRNGRVLDGDGNPWFEADVAIKGDRIAAVGRLADAGAVQVVDATGLLVAPGFIDTHTHAGRGLTDPVLSAAQPQLAEGITTVFVNPDGGGPVDLAAQREALLRDGLGVNAAQLVPHGSVREAVLGMQARLATPEELARMQELVRRGMEQGAWGLSSGPFYAPGSYSDTAELVALARVAGELGGAYQSHIRDESDYTIGVLAAVDEVIAVARGARLPAIVTHVKALGPSVWGFSMAIAEHIERARAQGLEVWADQYPYAASATGLAAALLPRWAQAGGREAVAARFADPATRAKIRDEVAANLERRAGADRIQFRRVADDPSIEGLTLAQVARARRVDPVDLAMTLLEKGGGPAIVSHAMLEDDVRLLMRRPWTMTASDGDLVPFGQGVPHPRSYGTFPRKLRYALDEHVITLEDAVRSMTSLPARVFRMDGRGELRPGAFADLVVFDPALVRDTATFTKPHQLAEGMRDVFVNGRAAIRDGAFTDDRPGRVLRRGER